MINSTRFLQTLAASMPRAGRLRTTFGLILLTLTLGLSSPKAHAQTYALKTLHSFTEGSDEVGPASLVNINGLLYGVTENGGSHDTGTIFSMKPDGSAFQTLYSFPADSSSAGSYPNSSLIPVNGKLYGVTYGGGPQDNGSLYSFDPATHAEKTLYLFQATNSDDGCLPLSDLINVNGILYGMTSYGGNTNNGTVFSFDPSSLKETVIHNFAAGTADGEYPNGDLIAVNGLLYGTAVAGGSSNDGIVFSLDPSTGAEQILHSFIGTSSGDASNPYCGLVLLNNVLYGTTYYGGSSNDGTVYSLNPNGTGYKVVYSFTDKNGDGSNCLASLLAFNGQLYGITLLGGIDGKGTIFSVDPTSGNERVLYSFSDTDSSGDNADGINPIVGLIGINSTLYGITGGGGPSANGTIFSLAPVTAPTAYNDACTIAYNKARTNAAPGVLANDNNGGEGPLTAALVSSVTHGHLTLGSDGSFTYTPDTGYVGTDTFTYRAVNPVGKSNIATVTLTVLTAAPTAYADSATINRNTARTFAAPGVLSNDDNGGSSPMTAALVSNVTHGHLTLSSNGSFVYTPNTGYVGQDVFTYQAVNPVGKSNTATVTLTVIATTPTAHNDGATISHNTARTFAAPGVLGNDDNGGSSPMTATRISNVKHGTLTLHSDGSFSYTPNTGYSGTDTFTYQVANSVGAGNIATVTLTVQ